MKILVIGTGYVGLVTATGLAELGHQVTAVDIDFKKINKLKKGIMPFFEPALKPLVIRNIQKQRLFFNINLKNFLDKSQFIFICVGTPPKRDGSADLKYIKQVVRVIGQNIKESKIIINKSTVPIGTGLIIKKIIKKYFPGEINVVSCPEFLREGRAVSDFFHPDRIVIGSDNQKAIELVANLFKKIKTEKLKTTLESAELIKYAANAFLATKISFINEIANLCEKVKADVQIVATGMGLDKRIGPSFLKAGIGYGGSCFPKDIRALKQIAGGNGYHFRLLKAVIEVNYFQRLVILKKIKLIYPRLKNKIVCVLGLAFKDLTDDVRESAAIEIIKKLIKQGAKIQAFDPQAMINAKKVLNYRIKYCQNAYEACKNAQFLIIATEWPQFKKLNWQKIKHLMKNDIILDGRNLLDKQKIEKLGFKYIGVGR